MSAAMVQLMKWKYAPAKCRKWREHVSHDCATHDMGSRTVSESKVTEPLTRRRSTGSGDLDGLGEASWFLSGGEYW